MLTARDSIVDNLKTILKEVVGQDMTAQIEVPADPSHGDYSSNIALVTAKRVGKNPMELAENIKNQIAKIKNVEKIEVAKPGFINFWLSKDYLLGSMVRIIELREEYGRGGAFQDKKILVEFAHPNTHKEFHIGHLRNVALGEAIRRLLEWHSAKVRRVNYQGDVGLHVAKAIYGLLRLSHAELDLASRNKFGTASVDEILKPIRQAQGPEFTEGRVQDDNRRLHSQDDSLQQKAKLLGEAYALGSKTYDEDEKARDEISQINRKIYDKESDIIEFWEKTRQWSLDYFDAIYKRVGTKFDRLYFESEVYESGKKVVLAHLKDGVFTKDQGAIIFDGEKYGLHKRVFVTKEGYATYEGKEMALGPLQYKEFPFDMAIHVVGPEQAGYFAVTFQALALVEPKFRGKEKHLSYGLVQLKKGKMSSRMGNVISGLWLLDETKRFLNKLFPSMPEEVLEQVAVGAVKYSMLRVGLSQNIKFSFEESISLEGNSGPYLQYTYARTQSVLAKARKSNWTNLTNWSNLQGEEIALLRFLHRFPEVVEEAAVNFAPNLLCNYLFELAQKFNLFYQKHPILHPEVSISKASLRLTADVGIHPRGVDEATPREFRLALTASVGQVLKNGLTLLGIAAPQRM